VPGFGALGYGSAAASRTVGSWRRRVLTGAAGRPGRGQAGQVTVPDGWHPRVELAGLAEKVLGSPVVAVGVGGLGVQDQPTGGDLLLVLLPQAGAGRIQGGGLAGELPGGVQVSGPVGLAGSHGRAVGPHARAVVLRGGGPVIRVLTGQGGAGGLAGGLDPLAYAGGR
jgi:hypothetical protein